ncbi:MAG: ATP-binding protein [Verrucomicrobiota bacterium]
MRSLRTRLVLISTLLPGLALVGVSVIAWFYMDGAIRDSVDLRLEGISSRIVRDMHPRVDWDAFRERLGISYGDDIREGYLVLHLSDDIEEELVFSQTEDFAQIESGFPDGFPEVPLLPSTRPDRMGPMGPGSDWLPPPGGKGTKGPPKGKGFGKSKALPGDSAFEMGSLDGELDPRELDRMLSEILGPEPEPEVPVRLDPQFATVVSAKKDWRVIAVHDRGYGVIAAVDLTSSNAELQRLERGLLVGIPMAIVLIGLGGWIVADRALSPIRKISETASHITAHDLSERMPENHETDPSIEQLIEVLNGMMDRLEIGFSHATRFSADVSHELKTPIAVIHGEIESALRNCEPGTEEEERLLVLREETDRLKSIIKSLLLLAQADVGELIQKREPVDLSEELGALVEDAEILSDSSDVSIEAEIEPGILLQGDGVLLRQALLNLVNNAIKYNRKSGFVRIELNQNGDRARVSVANSGTPISESNREKIFDRFYRQDGARTREVDGFGLGLSLARAVVEGHGGELRLARSDEEETRFEVLLPHKKRNEPYSTA